MAPGDRDLAEEDRRSRPAPGCEGRRVSLGILSDTSGFLVRRLHNLFAASWSPPLPGEAPPITAVQAGLLMLIAENPGVSQGQLAPVLDVEGATLVKSVSRLVEAGLVEKSVNQSDRRSFDLYLSVRGAGMVETLRGHMAAREERLMAALSPEEAAVFKRTLRRLIALHSRSDAWDGD